MFPDSPPSVVAYEGDFTHRDLHTRGIRLHAVSAGNPQDPLVLFLHDALTCWVDYADILAPLAAQGWHVVALDLRGYGMSDKPPHGYSVRHIVGDLAGAIRTLGHDHAHVYGSGVGAHLAVLLATAYPNVVASISLSDGGHPSDLRALMLRHPWALRRHWRNACVSYIRPAVVGGKVLPWPKVIQRNLQRVTTEKFRTSQAYQINLERRIQAASISHVPQAMVKVAKLAFATVPAKWQHVNLVQPVLQFQSPAAHTHLLFRALQRRTSQCQQVRLPETSLRPHLENPTAFCQALHTFMAAHTPEKSADN